MYRALTSLLSFRAELSPELPKGFVVFRHAIFAWRFLFGGEHEVCAK
jgi:hypothetical protein